MQSTFFKHDLRQLNPGDKYNDGELQDFVEWWNDLCDRNARNPYTSTRSRSFFLSPTAKFVDDEQLGVTAIQRARKMLSMMGRRGRR